MEEGNQEDKLKHVLKTLKIIAIIMLVSGFATFFITPFILISRSLFDPFDSGFPSSPFSFMTVPLTGFGLFAGGMVLMIISQVISHKKGFKTMQLAKKMQKPISFGNWHGFQPSGKPEERVIIREIVKVRCEYCDQHVASITPAVLASITPAVLAGQHLPWFSARATTRGSTRRLLLRRASRSRLLQHLPVLAPRCAGSRPSSPAGVPTPSVCRKFFLKHPIDAMS